MIDGTWLAYLEEIDTTAKEMVDGLIKELVVQRDVTEELKANDQFSWISTMEQINHTTEEFVFEDIVYVGDVAKLKINRIHYINRSRPTISRKS